MTKLTIQEYLNQHGTIIIACDEKYRVGDTIPPFYINDGQDNGIDTPPLHVLAIETLSAFLAQDDGLRRFDYTGRYFYRVSTD